MHFLLLIVLINFQLLADDYEWEINNEVGIDIREFHKEEAHSSQKNTYSNYLKSEIYLEISEKINFISEPYYRYDHNDKKRSLFNFKENYLVYLQGKSEVKLGISEIFWGVTESKNLVDIINVYDGTDGDQKAKLGQSMLSYSTYSEHGGIFDFYYLPFFSKKPQIGKVVGYDFQNQLKVTTLYIVEELEIKFLVGLLNGKRILGCLTFQYKLLEVIAEKTQQYL